MNEALKLKRAKYNLWTFVTSKMISSFGAQVCAFAISFYILSITGSAMSFAIVLVCNIIPRTVIAPFAGYVVDNYSRKKIVIISQFIETICLITLWAVISFVGFHLWLLYIGTALISICGTFCSLAFSASISSLVNAERLQQAMSLNQMSVSFSAILAPVFGGWIYGMIDLTTFFIFYSIASFIALILESTMNFKLYSTIDENKEKEKVWESIKLGFHYLKGKQVVKTIIIVALFINFLFGSFEIGQSYILIEKLKITESQFGLVNGSFALGMLIMSIVLATRKAFTYPLVISKIFLLCTSIYFILIPIPLHVPFLASIAPIFYIIVMFCFGATLILVNMPIGVMMQTEIEESYRGRVFSIMDTFGTALMPIGMLIFGVLFDVLPATFIFVSIGILVFITISYLVRRSIIEKAYPTYYTKKIKEVSV